MAIKLYNILIIFFLSLFGSINSSLKFNIPNNREKCFTEDIVMHGTLLIRYDLNGMNLLKPEYQEKTMKNIKIFVKNPKGKIIHETFLETRKGKFALHVTDNGNHYICARYYKTWAVTDLPKEIVLGIKIRSDYNYKDLDQSLHKVDVNNFLLKMLDVGKNIIPSIATSRTELDEEDKIAKAIISSTHLYLKLTLIQLILIFIIAFYHIFHIRKFLYSKRLI